MGQQLNIQVPIEADVDDTTRRFWLYAVLERMFVNDSEAVRAKTNDNGANLEEYLRKTDVILLKNLPLQYFRRVQILAELAVRIGWLGGIGIVAETKYT